MNNNNILDQITAWNLTLDKLELDLENIESVRFETLLSVTMVKATIADLYRQIDRRNTKRLESNNA
jgi:hypothetical protein